MTPRPGPSAPSLLTLLTLLMVVGPLACTESPDVVAIALTTGDSGVPGSGGQPQGGDGDGDGDDGGDGDRGAHPPHADFSCHSEALATLRIPEETLIVALGCEVSAEALRADEDARLAAISELLASTPSFEFDPGLTEALQCRERGLWWVEGTTVRLCQTLCEQLRDWLNGTLRRACPG